MQYAIMYSEATGQVAHYNGGNIVVNNLEANENSVTTPQIACDIVPAGFNVWIGFTNSKQLTYKIFNKEKFYSLTMRAMRGEL